MNGSILAARGLTKHYPGVVANDRVDLSLSGGEIHVLLGENGAGKSTLIAMLTGLQQPDDGMILVDGVAHVINSPRDALRLGIAVVQQRIMLAPTLTVAENLALGSPWWSRPDLGAIAAALATMSRDLGIEVDPAALTGDLSLGEQQQVEIARALMTGGRVLILDEATSMLTPQGVKELGTLMRRLADRGLAILFVSHKLNEAIEFGNHVTVLRQGRKVGELGRRRLRNLSPAAATSEIVALMFGDEPTEAVARQARRPRGAPPILSAEGITVAGAGGVAVENASLGVAPGEILGIAGIDGNGQRELAEALAGQRPLNSGTIHLDGEPIETLSVGARRRRGLRYLSDDRHHEGSIAPFSIALNLLAKDIGTAPFWSAAGVERRGAVAAHANERMRAFDVRAPSAETPIGRLSGGNLQKVILARELSGRQRR